MPNYSRKLKLWEKHLLTLPKCPSKIYLVLKNLDIKNSFNSEQKFMNISQMDKDIARTSFSPTKEKQLSRKTLKKHRKKLKILLELIFINSNTDKLEQDDLNTISINYYQGFNTFCSIFLILDDHPTRLVPLINNLSYNFLLDHLSSNFENTLIWLDLTQNILEIVDNHLFKQLNKIEMTYHFAMPWILTWFSHSVHDFGAIMILFDYFIRSHPLTPVYIVCALLCEPIVKDQILTLILHGGDMCEVYGYLQYLGKSISLENNGDSCILVRDLIKRSEKFANLCPVVEILSSRRASNLSDDSILWKFDSTEQREKVFKARAYWREVRELESIKQKRRLSFIKVVYLKYLKLMLTLSRLASLTDLLNLMKRRVKGNGYQYVKVIFSFSLSLLFINMIFTSQSIISFISSSLAVVDILK